MDRNTTIGFVLIGMLLIAMFYFNSKNRLAFEAEQKRVADSIARLNPPSPGKEKGEKTAVATTNTPALSSSFGDSITKEVFPVLENELVKITFSNKGGQPRSVLLKQYNKFDGTPVKLNASSFDQFSYRFNSDLNKTASSNDFYFQTSTVETKGDEQLLRFELKDSTGRKLIHQYSLKKNQYMLDCQLTFDGASSLFKGNTLGILWQAEAAPVEKDHKYELTQSHFCFKDKDGFDFEYIQKSGEKELSKTSWVSLKQQFFLSALVAKNGFQATRSEWNLPPDSLSSKYLTRSITTASIPFSSGENQSVSFQMFYGPSDYSILRKYDIGLENIVPYGTGIFAFVKYINRHFLLPVFDFLASSIGSMGIVILLLTLLIRLITSPILYKSYLSGAKMKVLKPEVDALREKYKDDQQTFGMEQMKLWKSAGVNPLGGCLPALLQIPIFMSLYYFFQSNISLRGKSFLWATDLSQYDSILNLPFDVPFYGNHVSLFTLTAVVTSLLISLYSMSNMQDNSNPVMKYMPYIFPVLLLGVFNNLPSALTWYYTISNTITLILQFIIQKYIINHDKIMAEMEENRKKPVKKSKLQERIEAMQESQKKLQDMKNRNSGK